MSENNIKGMLDVTMEKLRALVDADTVIGTPITVGEMTLIPVSRVSFGLATGGTDLPSKNGAPLFYGSLDLSDNAPTQSNKEYGYA